jgi:hypothetical protein
VSRVLFKKEKDLLKPYDKNDKNEIIVKTLFLCGFLASLKP